VNVLPEREFEQHEEKYTGIQRGVLPHRWPGRAFKAVLVARPNKFLALCRTPDGVIEAHVPDRGRCLDLLIPGREVALVAAAGALRRTAFTCLLARSSSGTWVSLDPAGAPRLVEEALRLNLLPGLDGKLVVRREVAVGKSRIDLLLTGEMLCEVKSVGAARDGIALFPDAPTERGVRHVRLLTRLSRTRPCAIVLCAQRVDVRAIAPDEAIDPEFAKALRKASRSGVLISGLRCSAALAGMQPLNSVPVLL
jgi:sugar fermentation stimulation protein A